MESRVTYAKRNIIAAVFKQVLNIVLPFIARTIVIYALGELYQGLNGLFTSLLQVLSLADLGFSTVVTYLLYEPIVKKDNEMICAIMAFLKRIYRYVALAILLVGLLLMPLIPLVIKGEYPQEINLYLLYGFYLLNSVVSYSFFAYKSTLLIAMQRESVVSNVTSAVLAGTRLLQIAALLITKNYYVFMALTIMGTIATNLLNEHYSRKLFPEIKAVGSIDEKTRKEFEKQIKGIMITRLADMARNSLDNVILSFLLGLTAVAAYDNYFYVFTALYGISVVIAHALQAGVGNSLATESVQKNYEDLEKFTFIYTWFTGWCTVCLASLYQPFMRIWMRGKPDVILSDFTMILFCIYFFAITINNVRNLYANGKGLFWELKFWYAAEAVANLLLNLLLGWLWGIPGIVIATILTIIIFNFIGRTNVLFSKYFQFRPKEYYLQCATYAVVTAAIAAVTYYVCSFIAMGGYVELGIKLVICMILPNLLYLLSYHGSARFQQAKLFLTQRVMKR